MKLALTLLIALLLAPLATLHATDAPKQKPNILLIVCDDLGYGDLAYFGDKALRTPNLDKLAAADQLLCGSSQLFVVAHSVDDRSHADAHGRPRLDSPGLARAHAEKKMGRR